MKQIEFERWEPDAENPCKLKYAGQRTAEDVFHELEARLDSIGYLPDEYLLLDNRWQNGREMPRDAGFFCRTDYGGSEGIYLDVFLEWYMRMKRARTESLRRFRSRPRSCGSFTRAIWPAQASGN